MSNQSDVYLHIDINSYFATLLQQETPALRGRPLAVVKDVGRTCIIAASKEAKALGIRTGSSLPMVQKTVPQIVVVPVDFALCWSATSKLKTLFESFTPTSELFSLDESFIHFTPLNRLYASPLEFAQKIRAEIFAALGEWVTCNIGIARTRFLAKLASETALPDSITEVSIEQETVLLANTTCSDACGIGHRLGKKLAALGVSVPYQINFIPQADLERAVGLFWTHQLRLMAQGNEPLFLRRLSLPPQAMKSVGRSITGWRLCSNEAMIKRTLYNLVAEVAHKIRRMHLAGRQVSLFVSGGDRHWNNFVTLPHHIWHTKELFYWIYTHLYQQWSERFPVIKLAVRLSLLQSWSVIPQPLLPAWQKDELVAEACDEISARYGLFAVTAGILAGGHKIRPEVTGFLGDKQYQFL
ncbi:MAG: hypothetical protein GW947_01610 [Candidatus Pacebacteria bacterium]|nr:hypothetical protein [Candidatus Paceibacterota bacterium]